jgi:hypothetical protein
VEFCSSSEKWVITSAGGLLLQLMLVSIVDIRKTEQRSFVFLSLRDGWVIGWTGFQSAGPCVFVCLYPLTL